MLGMKSEGHTPVVGLKSGCQVTWQHKVLPAGLPSLTLGGLENQQDGLSPGPSHPYARAQGSGTEPRNTS